MHSGSTIMTTFNFKPPPPCSSSRRRSCHVHVGAAAASPPPLIRRCPSVSWRWLEQRRHTRLQCGQSSPQQISNLDEDDSRLSQNAGIFHPSIWGDFFLGDSNPAAASSQQQVVIVYLPTIFPSSLIMISIFSTTCLCHNYAKFNKSFI